MFLMRAGQWHAVGIKEGFVAATEHDSMIALKKQIDALRVLCFILVAKIETHTFSKENNKTLPSNHKVSDTAYTIFNIASEYLLFEHKPDANLQDIQKSIKDLSESLKEIKEKLTDSMKPSSLSLITLSLFNSAIPQLEQSKEDLNFYSSLLDDIQFYFDTMLSANQENSQEKVDAHKLNQSQTRSELHAKQFGL
jgi:hypothetical protein